MWRAVYRYLPELDADAGDRVPLPADVGSLEREAKRREAIAEARTSSSS
jgi:hypothetical protein